ncbi:hypothetical protein [Streptomyces sp. SID1121]
MVSAAVVVSVQPYCFWPSASAVNRASHLTGSPVVSTGRDVER